MARIRTLKPEFWQDEKMALLCPLTRLVFVGLVSQADDAGRLVDNVKLLDGLLFPYTDDTCDAALDELARTGRILRYRSDSGQPLIQLVNWDKHQNVQKPSKYTLPAPPEGDPKPPSGESLESVQRVPVSDLRPTTPDLRPTPADLRAPEPARNGNSAASCVGFVEQNGYGAREMMVAQGEDITAWQDHTGTAVPHGDRLRLLKLADARVKDQESPNLRSALRYVILQQYDPTKGPTAADLAARKQPDGPAPQQSAPRQPSVREIEAKSDAAAARYAEWRDRLMPMLQGEPESVRDGIRQEANSAIGELVLRALPVTARGRTIEAKMLEIYGARIGQPQPHAA